LIFSDLDPENGAAISGRRLRGGASEVIFPPLEFQILRNFHRSVDWIYIDLIKLNCGGGSPCEPKWIRLHFIGVSVVHLSHVQSLSHGFWFAYMVDVHELRDSLPALIMPKSLIRSHPSLANWRFC